MALTVGGCCADGPFFSIDNLQNSSGVYIILTRCSEFERWAVLDIGESATVRSRVESHDRASCWQRNSSGVLAVAVIYTPNAKQAGRMEIEQDLRALYQPPCGDR